MLRKMGRTGKKSASRSRTNATLTSVQEIGRPALLISILGIVSYVSQVILHPIYGNVGTAIHHFNAVFTLSTVASLLTLLGYLSFNGFREESRMRTAIGALLASSPLVLPILFTYNVTWGPIWGPILTQAIMTWPWVIFVSFDISRRILRLIGKLENRRSLSLSTFLALSIALLLTTILNITEKKIFMQFMQPYIGLLWSRFATLIYLGAFTMLMDNVPSSVSFANAHTRRQWTALLLTVVVITPALMIALNQPHVMTGVNAGLLARLPDKYIYLARRESITGMITVIENQDLGFRVLRCDHSLLGGLWIGLKRKELIAEGVVGSELEERVLNEADSVYRAFYLQEAIRLVKRPAEDKMRGKALIMYEVF